MHCDGQISGSAQAAWTVANGDGNSQPDWGQRACDAEVPTRTEQVHTAIYPSQAARVVCFADHSRASTIPMLPQKSDLWNKCQFFRLTTFQWASAEQAAWIPSENARRKLSFCLGLLKHKKYVRWTGTPMFGSHFGDHAATLKADSNVPAHDVRSNQRETPGVFANSWQTSCHWGCLSLHQSLCSYFGLSQQCSGDQRRSKWSEVADVDFAHSRN